MPYIVVESSQGAGIILEGVKGTSKEKPRFWRRVGFGDEFAKYFYREAVIPPFTRFGGKGKRP